MAFGLLGSSKQERDPNVLINIINLFYILNDDIGELAECRSHVEQYWDEKRTVAEWRWRRYFEIGVVSAFPYKRV